MSAQFVGGDHLIKLEYTHPNLNQHLIDMSIDYFMITVWSSLCHLEQIACDTCGEFYEESDAALLRECDEYKPKAEPYFRPTVANADIWGEDVYMPGIVNYTWTPTTTGWHIARTTITNGQ